MPRERCGRQRTFLDRGDLHNAITEAGGGEALSVQQVLPLNRRARTSLMGEKKRRS
jgi:hypothetical protein